MNELLVTAIVAPLMVLLTWVIKKLFGLSNTTIGRNTVALNRVANSMDRMSKVCEHVLAKSVSGHAKRAAKAGRRS